MTRHTKWPKSSLNTDTQGHSPRPGLAFFFSSRRRHTRSLCDWSSDVCSSDLAEEMGAKVLIAVDIGTPLKTAESAKSIFGMLNQSIGVMMIQTIRKNRERADVLVQPDLEGFGSMEDRKSVV